MSSKTKALLFLWIVFFACKSEEQKAHSAEGTTIANKIETFDPVIEAESLRTSLGESGLIIIDCRKVKDYDKGHIPNSRRIWRDDIEDNNYPYKGMMADRKTIERLLSNLGVAHGDKLVVYDDRGGCDAARLWWVLQNYGYSNIKILNGGWHAWLAVNGAVSRKEVKVTPTKFSLPEVSGMPFSVQREELHQLLSTDRPPILIDARTPDEFSGKRRKNGAKKGGRLPNSTLIDWSKTIDFEGTHKFRNLPELNKLYEGLTTSKQDPIIVYCHSGVRSAHTTFVLSQLLGYTNVRNYDGSWSEWSYFDNLPFEKDNVTTIVQ